MGDHAIEGGDEDATDDVGWIDNGDWIEYLVHVKASGPFYFHARVASAGLGGNLILKNSAGTVVSTIAVPVTGDWHQWITVTDTLHTVTLDTGLIRLRLSFAGGKTAGLFNLNWVEFNDKPDGVEKAQRPSSALRMINGILDVQGFDKIWSCVKLRDLRGQVVAQTALVGGKGRLAVPSKGIWIAELVGAKGREVHKILVNR